VSMRLPGCRRAKEQHKPQPFIQKERRQVLPYLTIDGILIDFAIDYFFTF
jgi:hypothetical protein